MEYYTPANRSHRIICSLCNVELDNQAAPKSRHVASRGHQNRVRNVNIMQRNVDSTAILSSNSTSSASNSTSQRTTESSDAEPLPRDNTNDFTRLLLSTLEQHELAPILPEAGRENEELNDIEDDARILEDGDADWAPFESKEVFFAVLISNLPKYQLSDSFLRFLWWWLRCLGIRKMPSLAKVKEATKKAANESEHTNFMSAQS